MRKKLLAMGLCLLLLTGCGAPEKEEETADPLMDSHRFYTAAYVPLEDTSAKSQLEFYTGCTSGNYLYLAAYNPAIGARVDPRSNPEYPQLILGEDRLYAVDLETRDMRCIVNTGMSRLPGGADGGSLSIYGTAAGPDGSVWVCQRLDAHRDQKALSGPLELVRYNAKGTVLETVTLEADEAVEFAEFQMDSAGNAYGKVYDTVLCYDSQGRLLAQAPNSEGGTLISFSGGQVGLLNTNGIDSVFTPIGPTGAFGKEVSLCAASNLYDGVENYAYLYLNGDAVYGCDAETNESERLFTWMDYGVNGGNVLCCTFLPDGTVCAVDADYQELVVLTPVDAETALEKEVLTLAYVGRINSGIQEELIRFNRVSQDVTIQVRDYSIYNMDGDSSGWERMLNTEIHTGKIPDMFLMESMTLGQYSAQGLLMDLWPMIDGDEELSREDLMTHVFDTMSKDGHLYGLADTFYIQTLAGRRDVLGDRTSWTLEELQEARANLPEGAHVFGSGDLQAGILFRCVGHNSGDFLDWTTGECRFDTQEFRDILEFAKSFPPATTEEPEFFSQAFDIERVSQKEQLTSEVLIMEPKDFLYTYRALGNDASFVGFPSAANGSFFRMFDCLGISNACKNPEAAWRFARTLLTYRYQEKANSIFFPTNRSAFDECMKKAMTEVTYLTVFAGSEMEEVTLLPMTQEEYERFMALYESCDRTAGYNDAIMSIVLDEADYYFSGKKALDETVRVIQSRAGLYMAEQKVSS